MLTINTKGVPTRVCIKGSRITRLHEFTNRSMRIQGRLLIGGDEKNSGVFAATGGTPWPNLQIKL